MSRRNVRDAWLAEVMFSKLIKSDSCRRLLLCMALAEDARGPWMNERGRVRPVKHKVVGDALGISPKTVANLILQATSIGLLTKDPTTGYRGRAAAYQATIPARERMPIEPPVSLRALLNGVLKVPGYEEAASPEIREPFDPPDPGKVPGIREAQRVRACARVPKNNRESQPAPDVCRVEREHVGKSTAVTYGSWLPASSKRLSPDTKGEVA